MKNSIPKTRINNSLQIKFYKLFFNGLFRFNLYHITCSDLIREAIASYFGYTDEARKGD